MRIKIVKQNGLSTAKLIKRCGYSEFRDRRSGQTSFTHRLGSYFYPRFHIYIEKEAKNEIWLNLHLDQKRPSYKGCPAHSANYQGEVLKKEAERIRKIIENRK